MNIYKYFCEECEHEEILDPEDSRSQDLCPKCNNEIILYTDIVVSGDKCRVLISKKASDLKVNDLYFDRCDNKSYVVRGINRTTKKNKPAISVGLKGFGPKTILEDDIVYCVNGMWNVEEE